VYYGETRAEVTQSGSWILLNGLDCSQLVRYRTPNRRASDLPSRRFEASKISLGALECCGRHSLQQKGGGETLLRSPKRERGNDSSQLPRRKGNDDQCLVIGLFVVGEFVDGFNDSAKEPQRAGRAMGADGLQ